MGNEWLPYGGFKWLKNVDVNSVSENNPVAYILEVDLEYPDESHVLYNDYQLAPKKLVISYDILSDCCEKSADEYGIKVGDVKKINSKFR